MLGGIHVIVWTIGAGHTLLRLSHATLGAGHGDHTGPMALGGASIQWIARGAGRSWNGVLTRQSVSHAATHGTWIPAAQLGKSQKGPDPICDYSVPRRR